MTLSKPKPSTTTLSSPAVVSKGGRNAEFNDGCTALDCLQANFFLPSSTFRMRLIHKFGSRLIIDIKKRSRRWEILCWRRYKSSIFKSLLCFQFMGVRSVCQKENKWHIYCKFFVYFKKFIVVTDNKLLNGLPRSGSRQLLGKLTVVSVASQQSRDINPWLHVNSKFTSRRTRSTSLTTKKKFFIFFY